MCVPYFSTDGLDQLLLSFSSLNLVGALQGWGAGSMRCICGQLSLSCGQPGRWRGPERKPSLRCHCRPESLSLLPLQVSVCREGAYSEASKVHSKHPGG